MRGLSFAGATAAVLAADDGALPASSEEDDGDAEEPVVRLDGATPPEEAPSGSEGTREAPLPAASEPGPREVATVLLASPMEDGPYDAVAPLCAPDRTVDEPPMDGRPPAGAAVCRGASHAVADVSRSAAVIPDSIRALFFIKRFSFIPLTLLPFYRLLLIISSCRSGLNGHLFDLYDGNLISWSGSVCLRYSPIRHSGRRFSLPCLRVLQNPKTKDGFLSGNDGPPNFKQIQVKN